MHTIAALLVLSAGIAQARVPITPVAPTSTTTAAGRVAIAPRTSTSVAPVTPIKTSTSSTSKSTSTTSALRVQLTASTTSSSTSTSSTTTSTSKATSATSTSTSSTTTSTSKTTSAQAVVTTSAPAAQLQLTTSTTSTSTTLTTSTTSSAPACTSTLTGYGCLPLTNQASFVAAMLNQHNTYRARHNAPAMTWNSDLVPAALANAQNNANNNVFVHTSNDQYGENIAYQYGYNNPLYLGYLWYDEVTQYNFYNPGFSDATGHFTQLVWLDSTELGCAYVQASNSLSNNGYYYLSCEYNTPGNYYGEYAAEVLAPNNNPFPTQPAQYI